MRLGIVIFLTSLAMTGCSVIYDVDELQHPINDAGGLDAPTDAEPWEDVVLPDDALPDDVAPDAFDAGCVPNLPAPADLTEERGLGPAVLTVPVQTCTGSIRLDEKVVGGAWIERATSSASAGTAPSGRVAFELGISATLFESERTFRVCLGRSRMMADCTRAIPITLSPTLRRVSIPTGPSQIEIDNQGRLYFLNSESLFRWEEERDEAVRFSLVNNTLSFLVSDHGGVVLAQMTDDSWVVGTEPTVAPADFTEAPKEIDDLREQDGAVFVVGRREEVSSSVIVVADSSEPTALSTADFRDVRLRAGGNDYNIVTSRPVSLAVPPVVAWALEPDVSFVEVSEPPVGHRSLANGCESVESLHLSDNRATRTIAFLGEDCGQGVGAAGLMVRRLGSSLTLIGPTVTALVAADRQVRHFWVVGDGGQAAIMRDVDADVDVVRLSTVALDGETVYPTLGAISANGVWAAFVAEDSDHSIFLYRVALKPPRS